MKKGMSRKTNEQMHIIRTFREAGAFSVELSKSLPNMSLGDSAVFKKLIRRGIIVHAGSNSYFLDEKQWLAYRMNRVKWGMIALFAILVILSVWFFRVI